MKSKEQEVTAEFPVTALKEGYRTGSSHRRAVELAAATHPGYVRKNNEDHYLVLRFGRSLENLLTNLDEGALEPNYDLAGFGMLVADGIGGLAGGEVASSTAVARLVELVVETPDWILSLNREQDAKTVLQRMSQRFVQIDKTLREQARSDTGLGEMGTTLTVAATVGSDLVIGHVGDSRAYLLRNNKLSQLTNDHTLAQALIDAGVASADDPDTRALRHVLTGALGSPAVPVEPQVLGLKLFSGDQLLLCTDGLTEMVDNGTISSVLSEADSASGACQNLVDLALAGGGLDNITVVLARFGTL